MLACAWRLAMLLAIFPAEAHKAYLPKIGPGPLRFQAIPPAPPNDGSLPASTPQLSSMLPPESVTNAAKAPLAVVTIEPIVTVVRSPAATATNDAGAEFFPLPDASQMSRAEQSYIAPQTILPLFRRQSGETNVFEPGVLSHLLFVPPTRVQRPPSKATYSTP